MRNETRRPAEDAEPPCGVPAFWRHDADELLRLLDSRAAGLTTREAGERLARFGPNSVRAHTRTEAFAILRRQLESPLVLILVFAALLSLLLRDWIDASLILIIVACSASLGFVQERRASKVVDRLRERLALNTRVLREGLVSTVPAEALVPGDIVQLSAGNLVPADGMLIEARDFLVVESSLTGESLPVEKRVGRVPADASAAQRTNCAFLGSSVRSGTASMLVVHTGRRTLYGGIAAHIATQTRDTDFARGIRQFGYTLLRVMIVMVLFVLLLNLLDRRPAIDSMLFAIALAVGMSPELLPAIVTVTLAAGARIMGRRGVIVRRLEAIENLGSIDVLCTDKTGTLTEGVITLDACLDPRGRPSDAVQQLAYLNASLETGIENPLDRAIVEAGPGHDADTGPWLKIDEIPYDFQRKRLTIVVAREAEATGQLIVKGAFESLLAICTYVTADDTAQPIDADMRKRLIDDFERRSRAGYRVLGIASKRVQRRAHYSVADECDLTLAGLLVFMDRPKASARGMIDDLAALGVRLKIVSGDNRYVTAHLAAAVGLNAGELLTGNDIAALSDEALWQRARTTDVYAEIDPHQKERIVRALQRTGHAVGYLGDGINDAPALYAADVGISVEGAVDVARDSADVVLLGPDLRVLRQGIEDGRQSFANTMKYICVTTSANFGNMISMALGTLFLPFLPMLPKQILLNNLISDLPTMALAGDAVDRDLIARPAQWDLRNIRRFMLVFGLLSTVFDLLTFAVLRYAFDAADAEFRTAWFVLSLATELIALLVLRSWRPAWQSMPRPLLLYGTLIVLAAAFTMPYVAPLATTFDFVPLTPPLMITVLAILCAYVVVTEAVKARVWPKLVNRRTA